MSKLATKTISVPKSKLIKRTILVPKNVEFTFAEGSFSVKGPKGSLKRQIPQGIEVVKKNEGIVFEINETFSSDPATLGLYYSLVKGMIEGVSVGFVKKLTLIGVGYRAAMQGSNLELQVGFSNPVKLQIPSGIKVTVDKNVNIAVEGIDKQLVGQFAADIRSWRPPEPYKGKGIRYENEYVRKKAGKTGK